MAPLPKVLSFLACWAASCSLAFGIAGSWNGVAITAWNGIAQTAWNGTGVSQAAGGGGTSPGLTSIVAWYDFATAADADGNTYPLTETTSPTYTAGPPSYGTATNGTPGAFWQQSTLDNNFAAVAGDWSMVMRFRGYTSVTNGDLVFTSGGGRFRITWQTGGITVRGAATADTTASSVGAALNTWYTVVISHADAPPTTSVSVNGETFVTSSVTNSYNVGTSLFGAASTSDSNNIDIDFAGFWNKTLTQANSTWLYNSAGTRIYSDL